MTSPVESLHIIPGRARFRVSGLYHCPALKAALERELSLRHQIKRVSANPLTGSVLVEFDKQIDSRTIGALLEEIVGGGSVGNGLAVKSSLESSGRADGERDRDSHRVSTPSNPLINRELVQSGENGWHCLDVKGTVTRLGSSKSGLPERFAEDRLQAWGPNCLPELQERSGWAILLDQFDSLPTVLLLAAAGISICTGGLSDAIAIGGVLAINAAIGFFTESQSENAIRSLQRVVQPMAIVARDGELRQVRSERVVPGDIIALKPGSYVCADARVIEAEHLTIDESALTGEGLPVEKSLHALNDPALPLAERRNMVYMGTRVTGGSGLAIVVATGARTELGLIHRLAGETESPDTPMERQLAQLGRQLVLICSGICGVILVIGLFQGYGLVRMLETAISLAVASVPEGLPAVAATTLALGILKMRRHGVIIRKLEAVETLGCVKTVCLDKTGTLTLNRMKVDIVYCGSRQLQFDDGELRENGQPLRLHQGLHKLAEICVLCSETVIDRERGNYRFTGSPTENALVELALNVGVEPIALRSQYPTTRTIRRAENRNYMCTLHRADSGRSRSFDGPFLVAVKGSPIEVLGMCRWQMRDNRRVPLNEGDRARIATENDQMAMAALRVLGIAYRELKNVEPQTRIQRDLVWLGMVAMTDPIRNGVGDAIRAFHRAGIDTVMITGDQRLTASAIGNQLALSRNGPLRVYEVNGVADLEEIRDQDISQQAQVFARVSPAKKLQIVQALQRGGNVVAMTGDGINDSPALKAADIGIAMGSTGTDAARDVADVVLENDDLQTMLVAIGEGRSIYSNIQKSLHFLLSTNFSEIIVMFVALAGGLGHPLNAMQLLWINLISDILPGLALALEPPEPDVMTAPPRDPNEPVVKNSDLGRIVAESAALSGGALGVYGHALARYGGGAHAGTLAFTSLASGQLLHAVSCRSATHSVFRDEMLPSNRYLTAALGASYGLQALTFLIPGLRNLLGLTSMSFTDALVIAAGAVAPFLATESAKLLTFNGTVGNSARPKAEAAIETRPTSAIEQAVDLRNA
ncbi:MAG: HAD-IC family P-type ATPase [Deltaproteobacteria bacterium]|nr:HAD-IC family P-type ATPase [Deltaproteobacteria bacterium]